MRCTTLKRYGLSRADNEPRGTGAGTQVFGLTLFGGLMLASALMFALWDPMVTWSQWLWVVVGPLAGLIVLARAGTRSAAAPGRSGSYLLVFVAAAIVVLLMASFETTPWMISVVLVSLALAVAYLAGTEEDPVGESASLAIVTIAAALGLAAIGEGSIVAMAMVGAMFVTGAAALRLNRSEGPQPVRVPVDQASTGRIQAR